MERQVARQHMNIIGVCDITCFMVDLCADTVEGVNTGDSKAMVSNTGVGSDYTTDTRNSAGYNLISNTSSASSMPPYLVAYMWYRTA